MTDRIVSEALLREAMARNVSRETMLLRCKYIRVICAAMGYRGNRPN